MAKGEQHGNREAKKPKKAKPKTIAAAARDGRCYYAVEEVGRPEFIWPDLLR
jgi:hypothetical protein